MHEQPRPSLMHILALRETQRPPHKLTQPLPERVIPPLHVIRLPQPLADSNVLVTRDHARVRLPEIALAQRSLVPPGNSHPQFPARSCAAITQDERHHLTGDGAQRHPQPDLVLLAVHERPEFVQLERALAWRWRFQGVIEFR